MRVSAIWNKKWDTIQENVCNMEQEMRYNWWECLQYGTNFCLAIVGQLLARLEMPLIHCKVNPIYVFLFWELRGLSPNFHIHVSASDLYTPRIGPHTSLSQNRQTDPGNWYRMELNSQKDECRNLEKENYNSVLEITVSFLGIHKWELDIYICRSFIGPSFAVYESICNFSRYLKKTC